MTVIGTTEIRAWTEVCDCTKEIKRHHRMFIQGGTVAFLLEEEGGIRVTEVLPGLSYWENRLMLGASVDEVAKTLLAFWMMTR